VFKLVIALIAAAGVGLSVCDDAHARTLKLGGPAGASPKLNIHPCRPPYHWSYHWNQCVRPGVK
jgi:hypothetical protein